MPSRKEPAGVGSFGESEGVTGRIETVSGRRAGADIDRAGTRLIDVIGDEELGREIRSIRVAGGRQDDSIGGGNGAVAPVVEGVTAVGAIGVFGVIHAERVGTAGSPGRIVKERKVLGRVPETAVGINVKVGAERVR